MNRKGFPESYDTRRLLAFLREVKSGKTEVRGAVYSHVVYDIVPGEELVVRQPGHPDPRGPQRPADHHGVPRVRRVDYFDFSIYIDATESDIERWYTERFLTLRKTVFVDPRSYFRHFADLSEDEAVEHRAHDLAGDQRQEPGREHRADAGPSLAHHAQGGKDHTITEVQLRKI